MRFVSMSESIILEQVLSTYQGRLASPLLSCFQDALSCHLLKNPLLKKILTFLPVKNARDEPKYQSAKSA